MSFEITSPALIRCGIGEFSSTADEVARLGTRAVVVTGGHLHGSPRVSCLLEDLADRGVEARESTPVLEEPTVERVDALAAEARDLDTDVMIAIGGGSVMDTAKAAALVACNEGTTEDYQLRRREVVVPPMAQVFVPTTAGTGSEATRVSVLTNPAAGIKRSISDIRMTPDVAVLDPELTAPLSIYLTTTTAMDALSHAIESAVSRGATAYTRHMALAAIESLAAGLPACQSDRADLDARLKCLLGSCLAGLAMQAGLGASHSLAPAVCIVGGMRHSEAVAALLPSTLRLNESDSPGVYNEVRAALGGPPADLIENLCAAGGFHCSLSALGLTADHWEQVVEALNRYGSHRQSNPVEVTDDYARRIYLAAVAG